MKMVLTDCLIAIDNVDISDRVARVTLETTATRIDVTPLGAPCREIVVGVRDANVSLDLFQDYAAASIDDIFRPLAQSGTIFPVTVQPAQGAIGPDNPAYSMNGVLLSHDFLNGSVGSANTTTVQISAADMSGISCSRTTDPPIIT